ncbi:MAG: hypothetical protein O2898_04830, partial [Proteobacteria bacterium]|nr:hypothetical protein [Pseudomonadota bacterium]
IEPIFWHSSVCHLQAAVSGMRKLVLYRMYFNRNIGAARKRGIVRAKCYKATHAIWSFADRMGR